MKSSLNWFSAAASTPLSSPASSSILASISLTAWWKARDKAACRPSGDRSLIGASQIQPSTTGTATAAARAAGPAAGCTALTTSATDRAPR